MRVRLGEQGRAQRREFGGRVRGEAHALVRSEMDRLVGSILSAGEEGAVAGLY